MRSRPGTLRPSVLLGTVLALVAGLIIAPQPVAASTICQSGTLPDGSEVVCFLSGSNVRWQVPDRVTSIEYLVIAGGGGGGADNAGGGGAGGMITGNITVGPGSDLFVTVGTGGAAGTGVHPNSKPGGNGGDSSLLVRSGGSETVVARAIGGGGGGAAQRDVDHPGRDGGSGGGGAGESTLTSSAVTSGGAGIPGQGNRGGSGVRAGNGGGGGGGGAGAPGADGSGANGGAGGVGRSSSIIGRTLFFAGGGGGAGNLSTDVQGRGGDGGGGDAGNPAQSGVANTGGGGGGGSYNNEPIPGTGSADGAAGGSGIVVLRFTVPPIPTYTLTIDPNQGTCSTTSVTGEQNTWINLPGANTCTRADYEFIGFNTAADGSGRGFAPGDPIFLTGDNTLYAIYSKIVPAPFICSADLYQVSGTGGGVLYAYDPTRNMMDLVPLGGGRSKAPGANATGYNPADNFIYGIAPSGAARHLWKFGSNGVYEDLGPIQLASTGAPISNLSLISGDFIADDILLAIQTPSTMLTVDVAPTRNGLPALATQQQVPGGVWGAADIAVNADRTVGYGMGSNILYILKLPGGGAAGQIAAVGQSGSYSRVTVQGVPLRATYGAAYLDQNNNAYFYNNEQRRIYLITAAELRKSQPTAVPLGTERAFVLGTDQTLQTPTDGASCPTAPIVTVTLTYRINGGRGTTPADQAGFVDQSVTVADGIGFQREGFTFAGWNSAPDGSGASYPPGALYSLGSTGGVLFAQWTPAQPAPPVPPDKVLETIDAPTPPTEDGDEVIFKPLEELPAPPDDPWNPSSLVLVDPETGNSTPVVQDESGDWWVNNRTGDVTYVPEPAFAGTAEMIVQLQTVSGDRYQSALKTAVPSCQRGRSVRTTVYFDVLSAKLSTESKRTLNRLVRTAERAGIPTCTAVVGYVQPTPNRANDISLSTSRATSVADYLKTQGVDRIIRTEGLGRADEPGARARRATVRIYIAQPPPPLPIDG